MTMGPKLTMEQENAREASIMAREEVRRVAEGFNPDRLQFSRTAKLLAQSRAITAALEALDAAVRVETELAEIELAKFRAGTTTVKGN